MNLPARPRYEIAALLEQFGARGREIDFITACEKLDFASAERLLRAGFNPNENNDFARALRETKAKPLVGFYKSHRSEFPILDDQAAIALRIAVRNNEVRSAALLTWAGADPFRPAPDDLEESFANSSESEHWSTAAEDAMWRGDAQMLKALHLNPTPEQALRLLRVSAYTHDVPLFTKILASIPRDKINHTERGSCGALEHLVGARPEEDFMTRAPNEKGNAEKLQCIELLLDAGARWHPPAEELKSDRRYLLRHDPKYIVQLIRLLLYTPNAADTSLVLELCRSQSLLDKIGAADPALVSEIKEFSKQKLSSANSHSAENTQSKALVLGG